ncbi:nuclear transport factor 2 family protein [Qipengyuania sp. MTN3-11]|uniref:nuclear transport factor 2 family protein n=1 Tax=Qipengyuania sp. MTN3-11 TaxID=3056557 RepID=UPI0036F1D1AB
MSRKLFNPATWFGSDHIVRTRELVRMLNAREYEALEHTLAEDFVYLDTAGSPIRGRDAFLAAMRELYNRVEDMQIETDEVFEQEGDVLVKGRLLGSDPDYCSESLWRIQFGDDDRLCEMQAFRDQNAVSVTRLTAHLRREPTPS